MARCIIEHQTELNFWWRQATSLIGVARHKGLINNRTFIIGDEVLIQLGIGDLRQDEAIRKEILRKVEDTVAIEE